MQVSDKKLRTMKALLARVRAGKAGGTDSELDTAEILLKAMLAKYGLTEQDLTDSSENSFSPERIDFVPDIDSKKNPYYFRLLVNLLSNLSNVQVITYNDRLGCLFIGASQKISEVIERTEHAIERGKLDFNTISESVWALAPVVRKNEKDFKLGFSVGYHQALLEKLAREQASQENDADTQALILISKMLAEKQAIKDVMQDMQDNNGVKQNNEDIKVKSEEAYRIGVLAGLKAFILLLETT